MPSVRRRYYDGNLALQQARKQLNAGLHYLSPERWEESHDFQIENRRRIKELEIQERQVQVHHIRKNSAVARRKKLLFCLSLVAVFSFIFGGLMLRHAKIYELNFSNTALRNNWAEQREENIQANNRLLNKMDTAYIESEALRLFSLRKPSQMQRVTVSLPQSDQIILYEQSKQGSPGNQSKSNNYAALEAYMKSLSSKLND